MEARKARQKLARQMKAKQAADQSETDATQKAKEEAEVEAGKQSYLHSERIMQRGSEWRCFMVVLSACNSAKGYVSDINIGFLFIPIFVVTNDNN